MGVRDEAHVIDVLSASITRERTEPIWPCSDCGAETRLHKDTPCKPRIEERICSVCRLIQSAMPEVECVDRGRPRFPCVACSRETKPYGLQEVSTTAKRICVRPSCKKIMANP